MGEAVTPAVLLCILSAWVLGYSIGWKVRGWAEWKRAEIDKRCEVRP